MSEWRSVHELRPNSSTSGGQSDAGCESDCRGVYVSVAGLTGCDVVVVVVDCVFDVADGLVEPFIIAIHAAEDVHVRHLQTKKVSAC